MYAEEEGEVFLGRSAASQHASVSGETAKLIDSEVRSIIDQCYATAKQLLTDNRDKLDAMAEALMKYETIDAEQIDDIMAGRTPANRATGMMTRLRASLQPRVIARNRRSAVQRLNTKGIYELSAVPDPVALRQPGS